MPIKFLFHIAQKRDFWTKQHWWGWSLLYVGGQELQRTAMAAQQDWESLHWILRLMLLQRKDLNSLISNNISQFWTLILQILESQKLAQKHEDYINGVYWKQQALVLAYLSSRKAEWWQAFCTKLCKVLQRWGNSLLKSVKGWTT